MTRIYCDWCDQLLVGGDKIYSVKTAERKLDISMMNDTDVCDFCHNALVQTKIKCHMAKEAIVVGGQIR